MGKDINKSVFDEASLLKLDKFGECFEEWLSVSLTLALPIRKTD